MPRNVGRPRDGKARRLRLLRCNQMNRVLGSDREEATAVRLPAFRQNADINRVIFARFGNNPVSAQVTISDAMKRCLPARSLAPDDERESRGGEAKPKEPKAPAPRREWLLRHDRRLAHVAFTGVPWSLRKMTN